MKKTFITDNNFYKENDEVYNLLTDYVMEHCNEVPLHLELGGEVMMEVKLEDCYLQDGDFYAPVAYEHGDEVDVPLYDEPTLTGNEIQELLAQEEYPEFVAKKTNSTNEPF